MSSEELSSEMNFGDEEDSNSTSYDDDGDEDEDGNEKERETHDSDDFESITGFGSKVMNRPTSLERGILSQGESATGSKTKSLDQVFCPNTDEEEDTIKELYTNTFVENGPDGLGTMDALQISVVLEEMCDQLDVIGMSIDVPQVDLRSKPSVEQDALFHRPKVTIPAAFDPYSNSLFKEKYIIRQHYTTVAGRRIEQMCNKNVDNEPRKRLTMVLRDFGVHRYSTKGKVQAERTHMNIILDKVATELIQSFSFKSLIYAIDSEKEKYEGMKEKLEKSMEDRQYIIKSMETLKALRIEKRKAKKELQNNLCEFEGNRQELLKRKELEYLYVNQNGVMTKNRMKKMCAKAEKAVTDEFNDETLKKEHYEYAHYLMLDIIYKKYKEAQRRLEYWVEKYEVDKENLQAQLDQMKADRERDRKRTVWLKAMIKDYEQIAVDDRRIKLIALERAKLNTLKSKKAVKIQAWWRGEMYRKRLGPYNPKNKAKGAKGKGGKKK